MARARNPNRDKAFEIWADALKNNKNIKLKDIAIQLDENESKIRKWKCEDKWEQKINGTLQSKKRSVPAKKGTNKKQGAQPGNQNALKHGGYRKVYLDSLTSEELELFQNADNDEEDYLIEQIKLYKVSERRLLTAIKSVINGVETEDGDTVSTDRIMDNASVSVKTGVIGVTETTKNIHYEHTDNRFLRLQAELTKVQRAKTKCIETLARLHIEKERLELLKESNDEEIEDTSDLDNKIYGS